MKCTVLTTHTDHPGFKRLKDWCEVRRARNPVELCLEVSQCRGGDILFLIACHHIVPAQVRDRYRLTVVIHASDLPEGRGWSPLVWQVLEDRRRIAVTAVEAEDKVDSGRIWAQRWIELEGHELFDEINGLLFDAQFEMMDELMEGLDQITPREQDDRKASYYRRRTPEDSRLDPSRSLADQFDLLRISDPDRYPAFLDYRGRRYRLRLEKMK